MERRLRREVRWLDGRNSFELDGRGPSDRQLLGCGVAVLLVVAASSPRRCWSSRPAGSTTTSGWSPTWSTSATGCRSDPTSSTTACSSAWSTTSIPAANGKPNYVHIDLKPDYAKSIPAAVTARVVPSNVFAVSSVQLVDRGPGPAIRAGRTHPRRHRTADGAVPDHRSASCATSSPRPAAAARTRRWASWPRSTPPPRTARTELLTGGAQLNRLLDQLDSIVSTEPGPSTVSALIDATRGLQQTAPELFDALHQAVAADADPGRDSAHS